MNPCPLQFSTGDATAVSDRPAVIAQICNDIGAWGRGFVLAISKQWRQPEKNYRSWAASKSDDFKLGSLRCVEVEPGLWIANMIAQRDIRIRDGIPPIRYEALRECLKTLAVFCLQHGASVHMPRIGCGLAGGQWGLVEPIIDECLCTRGIATTVYDYTNSSPFEPPGSPQRGGTTKPGASATGAQPQVIANNNTKP